MIDKNEGTSVLSSQDECAYALGADINDRLHNAWMNYLHLHQAAYDVWRWFEVSRPDLIGPRAEALRDAVNGPRPYGSIPGPTPAASPVGAEIALNDDEKLCQEDLPKEPRT